MSILERIQSSNDIKQLNSAELRTLCGELRQFETRLECADYRFPLVKIGNMAAVLTSRMLFSVEEEYYEIRFQTGANLRKYLEIWEEQH